MLSIRPAQIDKLANARFAARLTDFLRAQFPAAREVEVPTLRRAVGAQIERAQRYGLVEERHVASYVLAAWLLGEEFDRDMPAAKETLNNGARTGADKAKWLDEWTLRLFQTLEGEPA